MTDALRTAWLNLLGAEQSAEEHSRDIADEWSYAAMELQRAQLLLEEAADGFGPVEPGEVPAGDCSPLASAAVEALREVPRDRTLAETTLALLAITDVIRLVDRQPVS